jgi:hypothetical protein
VRQRDTQTASALEQEEPRQPRSPMASTPVGIDWLEDKEKAASSWLVAKAAGIPCRSFAGGPGRIMLRVSQA